MLLNVKKKTQNKSFFILLVLKFLCLFLVMSCKNTACFAIHTYLKLTLLKLADSFAIFLFIYLAWIAHIIEEVFYFALDPFCKPTEIVLGYVCSKTDGSESKMGIK